MSPLPTRPSVNPSNDSIRRGVMKRLLYTLLLLPVLAFGITSTAEAQEARKVKRNANLITLGMRGFRFDQVGSGAGETYRAART